MCFFIFIIMILLFTVLGQTSCSPLSYFDHFLNESATGNSNKSNLSDSIDSYDRSFDDNKALSLSIRKSSFSDFNNTVSGFYDYIILFLLFFNI